ncbi:MAG TPA: OsmC family protein [Chryseolinea sp.]|nr:OsmC family protein [Chryseolinea sp.]
MVTALIGNDQYKTEIITSAHYLIADEPLELKGSSLGPAPPEFLSVALASCTAITLRMYADRKKWKVGQIKVDVNSESVDNKAIFKAEIAFEEILTEEQRSKLLQIANACPVHKTLLNPIEIVTALAVVG